MHDCYDKYRMDRNRLKLPQQGQALLIIILIVVVVLTIVVSLATRSITNSRITSEEDDSQKAFSAAEAGIEQMLKRDSREAINEPDFGTNTGFTAQVIDGSKNAVILNNGTPVLQDDGADLWLSEYPGYTNPQNGTFTVHWGVSGETCNSLAAIEVVVLVRNAADPASPKTAHYVFDECPSRAGINGFSQSGTGPSARNVAGTTLYYHANFTLADGGLVARIIPLYSSATIGVTSPTPNIPPQGKQIESTGTSSDAVRKISVFQSYPKLPVELFPYAIFSP